MLHKMLINNVIYMIVAIEIFLQNFVVDKINRIFVKYSQIKHL